MWQTYSVLSKTRKPRITPKEFLNYYNIDQTEIQEFELQEFLDFFEVSRDDLFMETKEEVILMLQGFRLDREVESSASGILSTLVPEDIQRVKFRGSYRSETVCGEIDFVNQILKCKNSEHSFLEMDKLVMWQVLKDMDSVQNVATDAEQKDSGMQFELLDVKGAKRLVGSGDGYAGIFLRIVGVIIERGA